MFYGGQLFSHVSKDKSCFPSKEKKVFNLYFINTKVRLAVLVKSCLYIPITKLHFTLSKHVISRFIRRAVLLNKKEKRSLGLLICLANISS